MPPVLGVADGQHMGVGVVAVDYAVAALARDLNGKRRDRDKTEHGGKHEHCCQTAQKLFHRYLLLLMYRFEPNVNITQTADNFNYPPRFVIIFSVRLTAVRRSLRPRREFP